MTRRARGEQTSNRYTSKNKTGDALWPGMALYRTMIAIFKPPSRMTSVKSAYFRSFSSTFWARARQQ